MSHAHLEALHTSANIPFDDTLTVRANKRQIIEGLGFGSGSNPTEFVNIPPGELGDADIQSLLTDSLDRGLYSALLIEDGDWQHVGGAPVVYVMSREELPAKLTFGGQGDLQQAQTTSGKYTPSHEAGLKVFARKKSVTTVLKGFDNYSEPMDVRLGGGFRLQIDDVGYEGGRPFLTMSAHFSFNDFGSRVLAKENEHDAQVPMASKSFQVPIVDGKLDLPIKDIGQGELTTADQAMDLVLSELFTTDGQAISELTRHMLTVRSAMQVHQLEGIYGVTEDYGISAEVIDFDGLDSFDLVPTAPTPSERLAGRQLIQTGFLRNTDDGAAVAFYQQQAEMRGSSTQLSALEEVSDNVKELATLRPGEDITAYTKRLYAYGRLARSLDYTELQWTVTAAPNVVQTNVNGWTITKVETGGFESAYIEQGGELMPLQDAKEIYDLTRRVLGSSMLRLYVSLSREGD
jgi:hypothetical protein